MGPPGFGKTLLLRMLPERLGAAWHVAILPYPKLAPSDLWDWIGDPRSDEVWDRARVRATAERTRRQGGGLVLCIDDAHDMPEGTRQALEALCAEQAGLHVLLETPIAHRLTAAGNQ